MTRLVFTQAAVWVLALAASPPALAASPPPLASPPPPFSLTADRGSFRVGEPVRLTLEVVAPRGVEVELPGAGVDLGPFELLSRELLRPDSLASGQVRHAARLAVTAYAVGSVTLPPLTALLRGADGKARTIKSDSLTLGIESVLPAAGADTADIRPLKSPIELAGDRRPWILAAVIALLVAGAALLLLRRRRRREPEIAVPARDSRPADVVALEALEALRAERLAAKGKIKEHYIRLTDIIRPYLERRFAIPALDRTTGEIMAALAEMMMKEERVHPLAELERLLEEADLVKFARFKPASPLAEGAIDRAAEFVRSTPRPPVVAMDGAASSSQLPGPPSPLPVSGLATSPSGGAGGSGAEPPAPPSPLYGEGE